MGYLILGGCFLFLFWSTVAKPYLKDDNDHPKDE